MIEPERAAGDSGPAPSAIVRPPDRARISEVIDHTLLKPEAGPSDIERLCDEAVDHGFVAVCVNPAWVSFCVGRLRQTPVKVATVIGFPLGASVTATKAFEAARAAADGADELDMVAAVGRIKSGDWPFVAGDIAAVVAAASSRIVKVIIESAVLTPAEITRASTVAREAGARYLKTSTGFHPAGGATPEAVALIRRAVGESVGIKASGGIRDCTAALTLLAAGATRLGTSSGVAIADCLARSPVPLSRMVADPSLHAADCRVRSR
jgi:deoxyribose-phosphate aldolase